jgi:hypothetical protein
MEPSYSLPSSQEPTTGIQSWANGIEVTSPLPPSKRIAFHVFRARYINCRQGSALMWTTTDCFRPWLLRHCTELVRQPPPGLIDTERCPSIRRPQALVTAVDCLPLCSDERWMDVVLYCRWKDGPLSTLTHIVWKENENTDTGKNVRLIVFPVEPVTKSQLKQESLRM